MGHLKRVLAAMLVTGLVIGAPARAFAVGTAFGVHIGSLPFDPVISVTPTGIQVQLLVLCFESTTREKAMEAIKVDIPDNTPLSQHIVIYTDALVATCGARGITVPRTRVFVPAFTQGQ